VNLAECRSLLLLLVLDLLSEVHVCQSVYSSSSSNSACTPVCTPPSLILYCHQILWLSCLVMQAGKPHMIRFVLL
jgi:hypothetical protein